MLFCKYASECISNSGVFLLKKHSLTEMKRKIPAIFSSLL